MRRLKYKVGDLVAPDPRSKFWFLNPNEVIVGCVVETLQSKYPYVIRWVKKDGKSIAMENSAREITPTEDVFPDLKEYL